MNYHCNRCQDCTVVGGFLPSPCPQCRTEPGSCEYCGAADNLKERNALRAELQQWRSMHGQEFEMRMDAERKLRQWEAIAERDHGAPIATVEKLTTERDAALARAADLEARWDADPVKAAFRARDEAITEGRRAIARAEAAEKELHEATDAYANALREIDDIRAHAHRRQT